MGKKNVKKSIRRLVASGRATLCPHCSGEGGTEEACCAISAGLDTGNLHYSCCCSCGGKGYHLVPGVRTGWFGRVVFAKKKLTKK